jgi:hypothetical protein
MNLWGVVMNEQLEIIKYSIVLSTSGILFFMFVFCIGIDHEIKKAKSEIIEYINKMVKGGNNASKPDKNSCSSSH